MADLIGVVAWLTAVLAALSGIAALAVAHVDRPRLSPRPRYRRTPSADSGAFMAGPNRRERPAP